MIPDRDAGLPATEAGAREEVCVPASQVIARVVTARAGSEVHLPARFARAALEQFLRTLEAVGQVVEGPGGVEVLGRGLDTQEWGVRVDSARWDLGLSPSRRVAGTGREVYVFPKHTVTIANKRLSWLLAALESVKPEELDAEGRPYPWVPAPESTQRLGNAQHTDVSDVIIGQPDPAPEPVPSAPHPWIGDQQIQALFSELKVLAGYPALALTITRGKTNRYGFSPGRVWIAPHGGPLRVHLTTCPNSDVAEILATLIHELSHPLSGCTDHRLEFKKTMVAFAGRRFGARWFGGAEEHLAESYHVVDGWVCAGIREALLGERGTPPVTQAVDDSSIAEIATKIRKARALAADRIGTPEGVRATAAANQLVTVYGLSEYRVHDESIDLDRLVDRWIVLPGDNLWRRSLAHAIAGAFGVFSLDISVRGRSPRMHFFGKRSDVVQAEYLFTVTQARVDRECESHLLAWRIRAGPVKTGMVIQERTSFCDSAVLAFRQKLRKLGESDGSASEADSSRRHAEDDVAAARNFAKAEHSKRGISWGSGGGRSIRDNAAGRELGESLEFTRGVGAERAEQRRLPGSSRGS